MVSLNGRVEDGFLIIKKKNEYCLDFGDQFK